MYDAKAQKKYNEKIKTLGLKVFKSEFVEIEKHIKSKGFNTVNSYLKHLVNEDMKKAVDNGSENRENEKKILINNMFDRLSDEDIDRVIDYIRLLLK